MDQSTLSPPLASELFPPSPVSPNSGFSVPAIIAIGFFATALVLIIYYLVVIRFWLSGRRRISNYIPPIYFSYDVGGRGVDPSIINSIPIVKFTKSSDSENKQESKNRSFRECSVCLAEFQEKESLKLLPSCSHAFHVDCIDTWLQFNMNCPMCRAAVTKQSLAQVIIQADSVSETGEETGDEEQSVDERERDGKSVRRSFSMDCFSERNIRKESESSSSSVMAGNESGRFKRLIQSFRLSRSSRSTVLPMEIEP